MDCRNFDRQKLQDIVRFNAMITITKAKHCS